MEVEEHKWLKLTACESFVGGPRSKHTAVAYGTGSNMLLAVKQLLLLSKADETTFKMYYPNVLPQPLKPFSNLPTLSQHPPLLLIGIIIFGGDLGDAMSNDLLRFDSRDCSWSRCMTMKGQAPSPRYHHSCDVLAKSLFIFGGYSGNLVANSNLRNTNDLYECRPDKGMWRRVSALGYGTQQEEYPPPRSAHASCIYQGEHASYSIKFSDRHVIVDS
jgi:hypothetical protein